MVFKVNGRYQFDGVLDVIKQTIKGEQGFIGSYSGFLWTAVGLAAYRAVFFGMYDLINAVLTTLHSVRLILLFSSSIPRMRLRSSSLDGVSLSPLVYSLIPLTPSGLFILSYLLISNTK